MKTLLAGNGLGAILIRTLAGSAGIRIVGMGFGFLVGIQLARGLGVAGYGTYGLAMSVSSIILLFAEFGIPHLITRNVASASARDDKLALSANMRWANRSVLMLSVLATSTAMAIVYASRQMIEPDLYWALFAGIATVPVTALGNLNGAALRGMQKIVSGQLPEFVLRPAFFSFFVFVLVWSVGTLTPASALVMQVIAAALAYLVALSLIARNRIGVHEHEMSKERHTDGNWRVALPMAITEGVRVLNGNVAVLILGMFATVDQVGVFRAALSMSLLVAMPVSLLHIACAPVMAHLYALQDKRRLQKLLSWVSLTMCAGLLLLGLPFLLFGQEILNLVFGAGFGRANAPLLVLLVGGVISGALGAAPILLNMVGQERRVARGYGLSLFVLALLTFWMARWWGELGVAMATSIAAVAGAAVMWWDAHKILKLDTSVLGFLRRQSTVTEKTAAR